MRFSLQEMCRQANVGRRFIFSDPAREASQPPLGNDDKPGVGTKVLGTEG